MFYLIDGMGDDIWLYKIMIILGINTQNDRKGHFYIWKTRDVLSLIISSKNHSNQANSLKTQIQST